MKLYGLTESNAQMKGYVKLPIFMMTLEGVKVETEAEAYVVPDMTILVLLGEDYQTAYKLNVLRSVEQGTKVRFGNSIHEVGAVGVSRNSDYSKLHKSTFLSKKFVKAKAH